MTDEIQAEATANAEATAENEILAGEAAEETTTGEEELTEEQQAEQAAKEEADKGQANERTRRRREQRRNARERRDRDARIEAEKEAAYWRGRAEAQTTQQQESNGKPDRDDFDTYEEYNEAEKAWEQEQVGKPQEKKPEQAAKPDVPANMPDVTPETVQAVNQKGLEKYGEDFGDMLEAARSEFPSTATMAEYVYDEEGGIDIMMHFYDHPEDAERIASLSPRAQVRALDELAQTIAGKGKPAGKGKISSAPAPVKPEKGGEVVPEVDMGKMDTESYIKRRQKQMYGV